jgi:hypothetical protein
VPVASTTPGSWKEDRNALMANPAIDARLGRQLVLVEIFDLSL